MSVDARADSGLNVRMRTLPSLLVLSLLLGCGDSGGSGGAGASSTGGAASGGESSGGQTSGGQTSGGASSVGGQGGGGAPSVGGGGAAACGPDPVPVEENLGGGADPEAGDFTMDEALAGLPAGEGTLRAIMTTDLGKLTCELFPEVAPNGVANFVGLARGLRPFKDGADWIVGRRFYDGLLFHRVIDNFMAQSGDPLGTGFGGPGYSFDNEIAGETHSPGTLAYANAGPDTNGSQFYIVAEESAEFLDGDYVIFGRCEPVSVVQALTEVETNASDRPLVDLHLSSVEITRCP